MPWNSDQNCTLNSEGGGGWYGSGEVGVRGWGGVSTCHLPVAKTLAASLPFLGEVQP